MDPQLDETVVANDPDAAGNPGLAYGLFQLRQPGLGDGYDPLTLQSGIFNGSIAATKMGAALKASGLSSSSDLSAQLRAIEQAGWPGSLSQDAQRQQQLRAVTDATNGTSTPATSGGLGSSIANAVGSAVGNALHLPSTDTINGWITNATITAILLAVLAGGFALLAAPALPTAALAAAA